MDALGHRLDGLLDDVQIPDVETDQIVVIRIGSTFLPRAPEP
jgi:hypothetical protein